MSFSVALRMLKDGYKVQRKGWGKKHLIFDKKEKDIFVIDGAEQILSSDLVAEDWREYRED